MAEEFLMGFGNEGTRATHRSALKHLFQFIKEAGGPEEDDVDFSALLPQVADNGDVLYFVPVDKEFVRAFVAWRTEQGDAPRVVTNKIRTVRLFFEFLVRRGVLMENPASCVRTPHVEQKAREANWLDVDEFDALLDACERGDFPERDKAIVVVAGIMGLRPKELVGLLVGDIQVEPRRILVHNKAKTHEAYLGLPDVVLDTIQSYLATPRRQSQPMTQLFLDDSGEPYSSATLNQHLKQLAKSAGITRNVTTYTLRHSAATLFVLGGATVFDAQGLLRHKDLRSTKFYTHDVDPTQLWHVQRSRPNEILANWLRQTLRERE